MTCSDCGRSVSGVTEDVSWLFRALANEHRRAVVRALDETHMPVPHDVLATYVAREMFSNRQRADFIEFRDQMLLKLHHIHLPMLADMDVIRLKANQIMSGAMFAEATAFLEELP